MVQQTAKRWRPSVLTRTRGDRRLGPASLARLLFLLVLAAALGLHGGVSEAADGDLTITVEVRDDGQLDITWDNPNSRRSPWHGMIYAGECGVGWGVSSFKITGYSTLSKRHSTETWAVAGTRYCLRVHNGTSPTTPTTRSDQTNKYFDYPEAGPGVLTITVEFPQTGQIKVTSDNPNSRTRTYQGTFYAGTCGVAPVSTTFTMSYTTLSKTLDASTWAVAGARYCVRLTSGTWLDQTDADFTYPGELQSYALGPPVFNGFTTAHTEYGVAAVFVPVPEAAVGASVSLTWTFSLTPLDVPEPLYLTLEASDQDGVVGVSYEAPGLLVYGAYTATVKAQGAEDDTAQSMTFLPVPDHIPFHAPGILKVTDQTPDDPGTASLLVAWSGAPAAPPTGFWIRYNLGTPLLPDSGLETNILRGLPPVDRAVGTMNIEVLAYYSEDTEVFYRGEDHTVPFGEIWFTPWSETYSINISRASSTGSEVPPKPVAPLVVETAEKILEESGLPADQAHSYSLLFLLFLTLGVGGSLYAATGGGPMSATLAGFVGVIIWSGLG